MALRVTQNQMYSQFVGHMNTNLANLMESNLQASSEKRINRPSDDAVGAGRVISCRNTISNLSIYGENVKTAMGWLSSADAVLAGEGSAQKLLTRMLTLAEQGSSGTYDGNNREQISYELREDFMQLLNIANTNFGNYSLFGGHKTDRPAFVAGLGVTCDNSALNSALSAASPEAYMVASGGSANTVVVQFTSSGTADTATYRYSPDGGKTWVAGNTPVVSGSDIQLPCGGATITMRNAALSPPPVTAVDPTNTNETNNGTWMYVRPAAIYQGDDNDTQVLTPYGNTNSVTAKAEGYFTRDVAVRVDSIDASGVITYSYSMDDGGNWTQGTTKDPARIPVPGGFTELSGMPAVGDQFIIHPRRADINLAISDSDSVTVNLVGKDVFGGLYQGPFEGDARPVRNGDSTNMFEVAGRLVAAAETNDQAGMQRAVEELKAVMNHLMTKAAVVGGRENRLTVTAEALSMRKLDEEENLSNVEDVDVTELMTRLAQQQTAYNSVLKSSSMIMQMSLVNFL